MSAKSEAATTPNTAATYTVEELATLLQCSTRHVHRLKDAKKIPGQVRCGRIVRFSRKTIDLWLAPASSRP